jgi:divalent metal cation (Fe/Co/Zn/Cd) transporter
MLISVNTIVNVLLVAAKAVAVLYSSSISLTASLVDSALDLLSTFIILGTSWAIGVKTDQHLVRVLVRTISLWLMAVPCG